MGKVKGTEKEEESILSNETGKLFVAQNRDSDQINPMVVPAEVGEVFVFGIYCDALGGANGFAMTEKGGLGLSLSSSLLGGSSQSKVRRLFSVLAIGYVSASDS